MKKFNSFFLILSLIFFFTGCGKKSDVTTDKKPETNTTEKKQDSKPDAELVKKGKEIFYAPSKETGLKCADCHSDGTNDNNVFVKYHSSIKGATKRASVYNGMFKGPDVLKNGCGATVCWKEYLKYEKPLTDDEINALNAYYESVSKGDEKPLTYTTIAVPNKDKAKLKEDQTKIASMTGDDAKGENLFKTACSFCHGDNSSVKKVPNLVKEKEDVNLKSIIYHVRLGSKYMPFFSYESISDQDLADICAFVLKITK